MNNSIAKQNRSTHWFIDRGCIAAFIGYFIGWIVLELMETKSPDGRWVLFGQGTGILMYWPIISFPFIAGALVICGAGIGRLMALINRRRWLTRPLGVVIGAILGAVLSMTVAAFVARIFDGWTITEYYGYFFIKCAAVIGTTSGALAGAYTGLTVAKT